MFVLKKKTTEPLNEPPKRSIRSMANRGLTHESHRRRNYPFESASSVFFFALFCGQFSPLRKTQTILNLQKFEIVGLGNRGIKLRGAGLVHLF